MKISELQEIKTPKSDIMIPVSYDGENLKLSFGSLESAIKKRVVFFYKVMERPAQFSFAEGSSDLEDHSIVFDAATSRFYAYANKSGTYYYYRNWYGREDYQDENGRVREDCLFFSEDFHLYYYFDRELRCVSIPQKDYDLLADWVWLPKTDDKGDWDGYGLVAPNVTEETNRAPSCKAVSDALKPRAFVNINQLVGDMTKKFTLAEAYLELSKNNLYYDKSASKPYQQGTVITFLDEEGVWRTYQYTENGWTIFDSKPVQDALKDLYTKQNSKSAVANINYTADAESVTTELAAVRLTGDERANYTPKKIPGATKELAGVMTAEQVQALDDVKEYVDYEKEYNLVFNASYKTYEKEFTLDNTGFGNLSPLTQGPMQCNAELRLDCSAGRKYKLRASMVTTIVDKGDLGGIRAIFPINDPEMMEWMHIKEASYIEVVACYNGPSTITLLTDVLAQEVKDHYARKDGAYEGMLVGTAMNLQGEDVTANSSGARTAGGTADIASGVAEVVSVRGNSLAWNQLVEGATTARSISSATGLTGKFEGYTLTLEGESNKTTMFVLSFPYLTFPVIASHKYLFRVNKVTQTDTVNYLTGYLYNSSTDLSNSTRTTKLTDGAILFTSDRNGIFALAMVANESHSFVSKYEGINLFDLTLIYGAGKEPTTAEQFEADYQRWFGKPLTYEEHDEGSVRHTKAQEIKTVGFNQSSLTDFEGNEIEWSLYDASTEIKFTRVFWKNNYGYKGQVYVRGEFTCTPKVTDQIIGAGFRIYYKDGTTTTFRSSTNSRTVVQGISTKDKEVDFIGAIHSMGGTIKVKNICINFSWSGKRDGEFEPHWEKEKALPLTTLTGKLGGKGASVAVFPDGMRGIGDAYDEIKVENGVVKAIRKIGSVDLGDSSYTWRTFTNAGITSWWIEIPDIKKVGGNAMIGNLVCSKFVNIAIKDVLTGEDKSVAVHHQLTRIYVYDPAFNDTTVAAAFKEAMQGVKLYYELAEPQEYILDDFELPLVYEVDDFGTEEILSPQGSVAPTLMTRYGVNAVDTLRRLPQNYISLESMDDFLAKLGAAMGGKWSRQWNESTARYDFSFTQGASAASLEEETEL